MLLLVYFGYQLRNNIFFIPYTLSSEEGITINQSKHCNNNIKITKWIVSSRAFRSRNTSGNLKMNTSLYLQGLIVSFSSLFMFLKRDYDNWLKNNRWRERPVSTNSKEASKWRGPAITDFSRV